MTIFLLITNFLIPTFGMFFLSVVMRKELNVYYTDNIKNPDSGKLKVKPKKT